MVLALSAILYSVLPHDKLPSISLPKGAQHNTLGELPFVEVMDDGNFYEIDGEENDSCWEYARKEFKNIRSEVNDWYKYYLKDKSFKEKLVARIGLFLERIDFRVSDRLLKYYHHECIENNKYLKDLKNDNSPTAKWMVFNIESCGSWCCSQKYPGETCQFEVENDTPLLP